MVPFFSMYHPLSSRIFSRQHRTIARRALQREEESPLAPPPLPNAGIHLGVNTRSRIWKSSGGVGGRVITVRPLAISRSGRSPLLGGKREMDTGRLQRPHLENCRSASDTANHVHSRTVTAWSVRGRKVNRASPCPAGTSVPVHSRPSAVRATSMNVFAAGDLAGQVTRIEAGPVFRACTSRICGLCAKASISTTRTGLDQREHIASVHARTI